MTIIITCHLVDFAVTANQTVKVKVKNRKVKQIVGSCQKMFMARGGDDDTNCNLCTWNSTQSLDKKQTLGKLEFRRRLETTQTTILSKSARMPKRVLVARGNLQSLKLL